MKAHVQDRYGSADVLELREIDTPSIGEDEVLVRVHAARLRRISSLPEEPRGPRGPDPANSDSPMGCRQAID